MKAIRICCFTLLLFIVNCGKSRNTHEIGDTLKESTAVEVKSDSLLILADTNYYRLLHIKHPNSEDHNSFQLFPLVKKKLRISTIEDFANDYEIRLYVIPAFHGIHCYRFFLKDSSWSGQRIMFSVEQDNENTPVYEAVTRWDVHPKTSWVVFIQELLKNNLLDMPTNADLQRELIKLHKLHPDHGLDVIDGRVCHIEIVSKGYYDYRYYGNIIALADEYPEATVMKKINALINALQSIEDEKTVTTSRYLIK